MRKTRLATESALIAIIIPQCSSNIRYILSEELATFFFRLGIVEDVSHLLGRLCELQLDFFDHPPRRLGFIWWLLSSLQHGTRTANEVDIEQYGMEQEGDRVQPSKRQ
jgi:hypothetical protein